MTAPPHLDWGALSQFDLHIRLCLGLPVPERVHGADVGMINLFGQGRPVDIPRAAEALFTRFPDARLHWYGKTESKEGRKMGHINRPVPKGMPQAELLPFFRTARDIFDGAAHV